MAKQIPELERLQFIQKRDGTLAALKFARQTIKIYRANILRSRRRGFKKPSHASLPEYRAKFISSYKVLKQFEQEYLWLI